MFNELTRFLRNLDGQQVSVRPQIPPDADGYIDRECPNSACLFGFKVHQEDWRHIVRDEEVFCPSCGHAAPAKQWFTTEQVEWVKEAAFNQVKEQFSGALRRDAQSWNRRQRPGGFVSITMHVSGRPEPVQLPLSASEPMRLKITCEPCSCRYSVIGSAYFCPSCGHNAADRVFIQSLHKIRGSLDLAPQLRAALEQDIAENTIRQLIEGGLQSAVTAFQRFAEVLFASHPAQPKARRNAFQNLEEGTRLWQTAFGRSYDQHLAAADLGRLARYFQQRHLLAHRDGLVDAEYVAKTGDNSFREGQRLVVKADGVRECVALVERLGLALQADATNVQAIAVP